MLEVQKKVCEYILNTMKKLGITTQTIQEKEANPFCISSGYINGLLGANNKNKVFQMSRNAWNKILKESDVNCIENLDADLFILKKTRKEIRKEIRSTYINTEELKDAACRLNVRPAELKKYLAAVQFENFKKLL